jgi:two-component sensor histidine kinase
VPFRAFAETLLSDASTAAGRPGGGQLNGGDQPLHPDQATPVTLVLLECFNNALEHAFVDGREGAVQVRLDQDGPEHVLTIHDNGAGPPEGFDPARSPSLGLRIVRAMAGQLGGKFEMLRATAGPSAA